MHSAFKFEISLASVPLFIATVLLELTQISAQTIHRGSDAT